MINNIPKFLIALAIASVILVYLSPEVNSLKTYGNRSETVTLMPGTPKPLNLTANLTMNDKINHTFQMKDVGNLATFTVEYTSGNRNGYLFKLIFDDRDANNNVINFFSCDGTSQTELCTGGCGDFFDPTIFTVSFNPSTSKADIYKNFTLVGSADICSSIEKIDYVNVTGTGSTSMSNNIVTADNLNPSFLGNLPNITWPEDTSTSFNISGNFSDSNNDALTYTYTNVENISISINNATGIVNLTPNPDFNGTRYATFTANDGENLTQSNQVTLNVTNVNDAPAVTSATISSSDFLNRTNGSLTASWTFSDSDNEIMSGNETLWYLNGTEDQSLRNLTAVSPANTTKNQNWSFSVRVYDGANFSSFVTSINLTIDNALQSFNHSLGVESVERSTLFTYDINYTDIDNDTITFLDNSSLFGITSEGIINFTPAASGNITVNITLREDSDVSGILTIEVKDTIAPVITAISASSSGTTAVTVTLSVTTDETAECRFATLNINYADMGLMSATNSTSHSNSQSFTSDASGTYYARCNDTSGNVMSFSNSTSFSAVITEEASAAATADSPNSGGGGGWQCRYDWKCAKWSDCINGKKTRDCEVVKVEPFYSETKCEYMSEIDTEVECEMPKKEEPEVIEEKEEKLIEGKPAEPGLPAVTGGVIALASDLIKNARWYHTLIAGLILAVIGVSAYLVYFKKPPVELTEEERAKLQKMLEKIDKV